MRSGCARRHSRAVSRRFGTGRRCRGRSRAGKPAHRGDRRAGSLRRKRDSTLVAAKVIFARSKAERLGELEEPPPRLAVEQALGVGIVGDGLTEIERGDAGEFGHGKFSGSGAGGLPRTRSGEASSAGALFSRPGSPRFRQFSHSRVEAGPTRRLAEARPRDARRCTSTARNRPAH